MPQRYRRVGERLYELTGLDRHARDRSAWKLFVEGIEAEDAGEKDAALRLYEEALLVGPTMPEALVNAGTIYFQRKEFGIAEKYYRRAVESDPSYAIAWFDLANVLDERGFCDESAGCYLKAIAACPAYPDAHYNLGLTYERMGEHRKAAEHFRSYVRFSATKDMWTVEAKRKVERLRRNDLQLVPNMPMAWK